MVDCQPTMPIEDCLMCVTAQCSVTVKLVSCIVHNEWHMVRVLLFISWMAESSVSMILGMRVTVMFYFWCVVYNIGIEH